MYVIGTSGHVDHGKTLLIESLTGINADRLPEERERGMTIDLGFAFFKGSFGSIIGVVDVPGHERFIRNMVAGAWGLDCALLVVAADDGWMRQTEDHGRVLKFLKVPCIIPVITKSDIVSSDLIPIITEEIKNRYQNLFGITSEPVIVSAVTGTGIDELKERIEAELAGLPREETGQPYLYIDRIFSKKGTGSIIAGTLRGGPIIKDQTMVLLPQNKEVRIRALQSYHEETGMVNPVCRAALNCAGVKTEELHRGQCLTLPEAGFNSHKEIVGYIYPPSDTDTQRIALRNHSEIEISAGTGHSLASIHFIGGPSLARIVLKEPIPLRWNQPFILLRHGGSSIITGGRAIWFGETNPEERKQINAFISEHAGLEKKSDFFLLSLKLKGYIPLTSETKLPKEAKGKVTLFSGWVCDSSWLLNVKSEIYKLADCAGGISQKELPGKLNLPAGLAKQICSKIIESGELIDFNSIVMTPRQKDRNVLSPLGMELAELLKANDKEGVEISKLNQPGAQKELRNLSRLGLAVSLEGNIFYSKELYTSLLHSLLKDSSIGDTFSVPQAKEKLGLTRKYILPLLNKLESDGFVKRDGDIRIVLRVP